MAKWRRGGGGRRARWVIEWVPVEEKSNGQLPMVDGQLSTGERVDPFEHDDPYAIRHALAALENGQLPMVDGQLSTEEETAIVDG